MHVAPGAHLRWESLSETRTGNLATTTIMAACYRRTVAFSGAVEDAEKWHLWETSPPALSIYYLCTVNEEKE